jgi:hypothetical protein
MLDVEEGWVSGSYGARERGGVCRLETRDRDARAVTLLLPTRGEGETSFAALDESGRAFVVRGEGYEDRVLVGGRDTDAELAWIGDDEFVMVGGSTIRLGADVVRLGRATRWSAGTRTASGWRLETSEG